MPRRIVSADGNTTTAEPRVINYTLDPRKRMSHMFALAMDSGLFVTGKVSEDILHRHVLELLGLDGMRYYQCRSLYDLLIAADAENGHWERSTAEVEAGATIEEAVTQEPEMVQEPLPV